MHQNGMDKCHVRSFEADQTSAGASSLSGEHIAVEHPSCQLKAPRLPWVSEGANPAASFTLPIEVGSGSLVKCSHILLARGAHRLFTQIRRYMYSEKCFRGFIETPSSYSIDREYKGKNSYNMTLIEQIGRAHV